MRRQATDWEKIFAKDTSDKGLLTKLYKELLEENIGRTLYDINHSKILFDPPPREMEVKTK